MVDEYEIKITTTDNSLLLLQNLYKFCTSKYESPIHNRSLDVNVSIDYKSNIRKSIEYDNRNQAVKESYMVKTKVENIDIKPLYSYKDFNLRIRLSHSKEENVDKEYYDKHNINNIIYRLKNRYTFIINDNFKVDITIVKQLKTVTDSELNILIATFFNKKIDSIVPDNNTYYETEMEYIGSNKYSLNKMKDELDVILSNLDVSVNHLSEMTLMLYNTSFKWFDFLNHAVSLNVFKYSSMNRFDCHLITEKTDGERTLVFIHNNNLYLMFSKNSSQIKHVIKKNLGVSIVLEGETIEDNKILIYDVLFIEKDIKHLGYQERINHFSKCKNYTDDITEYKIIYKEFGLINNSDDGVKNKKDIKSLIDKYFVNNKNNIDGLIFSTTSNDYKNTANYKWKPSDKSSIDFYLASDSKSFENKATGTYKYKLYVSIPYKHRDKLFITDRLYNIGGKDHMLFKPSYNSNDYTFETKNKNLNGKIVELVKDKKFEWIALKIREDKIYANSLDTAEDVYINYYYPLTIERLANGVPKSYFNEITDAGFKNSKTWNNKVKYQLYTLLRDKDTLLDLAAGRGADIPKYIEFKIKNVIMAEIDEIALQEAIVDRKYYYLSKFRYDKHDNTKFPNLYGVNCDLTIDYNMNTQHIVKHTGIKSVDSILISLAIHYFVYNDSLLSNLYNLIENFLKPKGVLIITLFDGKQVFDLLKKNKGEWIAPNGYHIKYKNNKVDYKEFNDGIEILLKHPFSSDLESEYLIDKNRIIKAFTKGGYSQLKEYSKSFIDYKIDVVLDEYDKIYTSLFCSIVLVKN